MVNVRGRVMSFVNFLTYLYTVESDFMESTVVEVRRVNHDVVVVVRLDYEYGRYEFKKFKVSYKVLSQLYAFFGGELKADNSFVRYEELVKYYNVVFSRILEEGYVGVLVPRKKQYRLEDLTECSEIPKLEKRGFKFSGGMLYIDAVPSKEEGYHDVAYMVGYMLGDYFLAGFLVWVTVCTRGLQEHEIENSAVVVSTFEEVERYLEG